MALSLKERDRRYKAIRELMIQDKFDALLVAGRGDSFSRGNIRYITNQGIIAGEQHCVFGLEGDPVYMLPGKGPVVDRLRKAAWSLDLREAYNLSEKIIADLSRLDKGNKIGIVGMQEISVPLFLAVQSKFGNRLVNAVKIFEQLRSIKSDEEIEKMRTAAGIADKIFTTLKDIVKPGVTDYEIYGEVRKIIHQMGCEYSFELISAEDANMNLYSPTGDKLKKDGTLSVEISPAYEGYYAQMPVTIAAKDFPPRLIRLIDIWKEAVVAAESAMRPGVTVSNVHSAIETVVRNHGCFSPWRHGHALGLDLIDFWSITDTNPTVLKPGMTLVVHPDIFEPGFEGIGPCAGYTYVINNEGAENLSEVDIFE
jgi:Xaa-Pro aminopeptidase